MEKKIKISVDHEKERLDMYLSEHEFTSKSRSYVQNLIKDKHILVNDQKVKTGYLLKTGDIITIFCILISAAGMEAIF